MRVRFDPAHRRSGAAHGLLLRPPAYARAHSIKSRCYWYIEILQSAHSRAVSASFDASEGVTGPRAAHGLPRSRKETYVPPQGKTVTQAMIYFGDSARQLQGYGNRKAPTWQPFPSWTPRSRSAWASEARKTRSSSFRHDAASPSRGAGVPAGSLLTGPVPPWCHLQARNLPVPTGPSRTASALARQMWLCDWHSAALLPVATPEAPRLPGDGMLSFMWGAFLDPMGPSPRRAPRLRRCRLDRGSSR